MRSKISVAWLLQPFSAFFLQNFIGAFQNQCGIVVAVVTDMVTVLDVIDIMISCGQYLLI